MTMHRFPLSWPVGYPRSTRRVASKYQVDASTAWKHLAAEARMLGGSSAVISSNVPLKFDGKPYADTLGKVYADPGVAVYWTDSKKQMRCLAVDQFGKLHENMRGLGLSIAALRQMQRAGASQVLDRVYSAFAALPASTSSVKRSWRDVFGFQPGSRPHPTHVKRIYHELAATQHPDKSGGSHAAFVELNVAFGEARAELGAE